MNILNKRKVTLFAILTLTLSLGVTSKGRINKKPLEESSVVTKTALVNKPLAKSPGANVVTLTVYNPTVVIPGGQIPQGAGVNFNSTSNLDSEKRLDATYKQTLKVTSPNEIHLTNLTLLMKSEVSSGAGSLKYSFDNITYTDIIPTATPFNDPLWYGAWSTTYVDVVKPLDLLVQGDIYFEIEASSDALYNEKFSFTWDYTIPPLTGLTMNKSSTSIVRTYSEQLSVTPNPEGASSSVTWSTSNASVATVSADGLVTGVDGGDAIITATSTVNTSIKTTCQVTVTPHLPGYKKITNDSELRFGATYTFAKFDTLDAAKFDDSLTYIPQYSATASPSGGMSVEGQALRLVLEPSSTPYLYSFRVVGTNKYLSGPTDLINHIHFAETKGTPQTTLKVSREDIGTEVYNDSQYFLRHDPSKPGFGYFENDQIAGTTQISIYVDLTTVNSINEATTFANEVMYGFGFEAEHICEARLEILQAAYDMMTSSGKNEFDTNTDELFVNARARLAYMEAWVTLNSGSPLSIANNTNTTIFALVVISVLGVSVTFAYFYLNKKKI